MPRNALHNQTLVCRLAILAILGLAAAASGQGEDAVERVRAALKSNGDAQARNLEIREALNTLGTADELRRAYLLPEWRDRTPEFIHAEVDRALRRAVAERYAAAVRLILRGKDSELTATTLEQIADMAGVLRGRGEDAYQWWSQEYLRLLRQGSPRVRVAAARAVGQTEPPLEMAVPALASLLKATDPAVRLAGADGLAALVLSSVQAVARTNGTALEARQQMVLAAQSAAPALAHGLSDAHVAVRRRCAGAIGQMAGSLTRLLPEPSENNARVASSDIGPLKPFAQVLRDQAPAMARSMRDSDAQVRLLAQKALEEMAVARVRWLQAGGSGDPLLEGLQAALPALANALADPNERVRRAAIDVLEPLGAAAAPAVPALVGALGDSDRFVRWSAVRTLGGLGPAARPAVAALTRLREDPDPDIRRAAAAALARIEPAARVTPPAQPIQQTTFRSVPTATAPASVPDLLRGLKSNEVQIRSTAAHMLRGLGAAAQPAIPALREALRDGDPRVRQAAALALGQLGGLARAAADDLRVLVADPDADVRRAAGDALVRVYK